MGVEMKRQLLLAAAFAFAASGSAHAAEFKVSKPPLGQKLTIVYLDGEIVEGDQKKFETVTKGLKGPVAVSLNSPGGLILDGLNIGIDIRNNKWRTIARECYSVCANIWLAGVERGASKDTKLGFHAGYIKDKDGKTSEDGVTNALVGAYLFRMGFGYDFIAWATTAAPDSITMLGDEEATKYHIAYTFIK
jgi:hypothetical protein